MNTLFSSRSSIFRPVSRGLCAMAALTATVALHAAHAIQWDAINVPTANCYIGSNIQFTATVTNTGDTTWDSATRLEVQDSAGRMINSQSVAGTPPGGTTTATFYMSLPETIGIYGLGFRAKREGTGPGSGYFGLSERQTLNVIFQPPAPIGTGGSVWLSAYNFLSVKPPSITTNWATTAHYRLRAKVSVPWDGLGFHAATTRENNGLPLDALPPPGNYPTTTFYWLRYDENYVLQEIGPGSNHAITVVEPPVTLTSYWVNKAKRPRVLINQNLPLNYKLKVTIKGPDGAVVFQLADSWNNDTQPVADLPVVGTYQIETQWVKYDARGVRTGPVGTPQIRSLMVVDGPDEIFSASGTIYRYEWYDNETGDYSYENSSDAHTIDVAAPGNLRLNFQSTSGCTYQLLNSSSSVIASSGASFPVSPGVYTLIVSGSAESAFTYSAYAELTPSTAPPVVTTTGLYSATVGDLYQTAPITTNVASTPANPVVYYAGDLPLGLYCDATTGVIAGTPQTASPYPYKVKLWASNQSGDGPSKEVLLTVYKGYQHVVSGQIPDHVTTDAPFDLLATASSGLPLVFSVVGGPATVNGSTVTLTANAGVGMVLILASQPGDDNYLALPPTYLNFIVWPPVPPTIQTQPASRSVAPGASVSLSVVATGDAPLAYQWRKNGINLANGGNIGGAASATLTLASFASGDAGGYSVVVSNGAGSTTSNLATFDVAKATPVLTVANITVQNQETFPLTLTETMLPPYAVAPSANLPAPSGAIRYTGYRIAIPNMSYNPLTPATYPYQNISPGKLSVTATYDGDNNYLPATKTVIFQSQDTLPPVFPNGPGLATVLAAPTSLGLKWNSATDPGGVLYDLSVDGGATVYAGGLTKTEAVLYNLTAGATYQVAVRARDTFGNPQLLWSAPLAVTMPAAPPPASNSPGWVDVDGDGLLDEIIRPNSARFTRFTLPEPYRTFSYTEWLEHWTFSPGFSFERTYRVFYYNQGEQVVVAERTVVVEVPGTYIPDWSENTITYTKAQVMPVYQFITEPGYAYSVNREITLNNAAHTKIYPRIFEPSVFELLGSLAAVHEWSPEGPWLDDVYDAFPQVLVRYSKPVGSVQILDQVGNVLVENATVNGPAVDLWLPPDKQIKLQPRDLINNFVNTAAQAVVWQVLDIFGNILRSGIGIDVNLNGLPMGELEVAVILAAAAPRKIKVHTKQILVKQVIFADAASNLSDWMDNFESGSGTTLLPRGWVNGGVNNPVTIRKEIRAKLNVTVQVLPANTVFTLRGFNSTLGLTFTSVEETSTGSDQVVTAQMLANQSLPKAVVILEGSFNWSLGTGGAFYQGNSSGPHKIYVTWDYAFNGNGNPLLSAGLTLKRLDWACQTARDQTSTSAIAAKIYDAMNPPDNTTPPVFGSGNTASSWALLDGGNGDCKRLAQLMVDAVELLGGASPGHATVRLVRASTNTGVGQCLAGADGTPISRSGPNNTTQYLFLDFNPGGNSPSRWNRYEGCCESGGRYFALGVGQKIDAANDYEMLKALGQKGVQQVWVTLSGSINDPSSSIISTHEVVPIP